MAAVAAPAALPRARREHQRRVAALLDELDRQRRRLALLQAAGARPAALRDLKSEFKRTRARLAQTVGGA